MTKTIKRVVHGEGYFRYRNPFVLWSGNKIKHVVNPSLFINLGFLNKDGSIDLCGYFKEQQSADDPADWYKEYSIYTGRKTYTGYAMIHIPSWSCKGRIKTVEDILQKVKWDQATFSFSYPREFYKVTLKNINKEVQA
jgi:hypothetical protein